MPDLITHGLAAYSVRRPLGLARYTGALMLGTVLPDFLSRFALKVLGEVYYSTGWFPGAGFTWFWCPLHTPFTLALVCWALALLFEERLRRGAFAALLAGVLIHLGLDFLQAHTGGGDPVLFPFTWKRFEKGLFGPEASVAVLPALAGAAVVLEIGWRRLSGEGRKGRKEKGARPPARENAPL